MRPAVSFFFGHIGDKYGRKNALLLTFWVMGIATIVTGLVPSWASIGIAAPILMTIARMAQGFGAGGEWGSGSAYLIELGGKTRRGFYASMQNFISLLGILSSTAIGYALVQLPSSVLSSVGWRIPFIVGGATIIPIAYLSRKKLPETDLFKELKAKHETESSPILSTLRNDYKPFFIIIFSTAALTTAFYGSITYMTTYVVTVAGLSLSIALATSLTSLFFVTFLTPVFGYLSDMLKTRKKLFMVSTVLMIFVTPAFFLVVGTHEAGLIIFMAAVFGVVASIAAGTLVPFISESFPTAERVTGNTSYNISAAYFGGFAPAISIALIALLHSQLAPAYYVMAVGIMSTIAISFAKDTGKIEDLPETASLYKRTDT